MRVFVYAKHVWLPLLRTPIWVLVKLAIKPEDSKGILLLEIEKWEGLVAYRAKSSSLLNVYWGGTISERSLADVGGLAAIARSAKPGLAWRVFPE